MLSGCTSFTFSGIRMKNRMVQFLRHDPSTVACIQCISGYRFRSRRICCSMCLSFSCVCSWVCSFKWLIPDKTSLMFTLAVADGMSSSVLLFIHRVFDVAHCSSLSFFDVIFDGTISAFHSLMPILMRHPSLFLNSVSVSGNSNSFILPITCSICHSTKSVARSLVVWPILECSMAWKQLSTVTLLQQGTTSTSISCFRKWSTFPCKTLDHSGHK